MNGIVRSGLALLGLSLVAPWGARAQTAMPSAPAGYQAPVGLDGKPLAAPAGPSSAPHKHKVKTLCARCAAAQDARMKPPGKIVGCAHSRNGVCTACKAALAMPGEIVMMSSPMPAEAPGRVVVNSGPAPTMPAAPSYDPSGEPAPVGVVRTNFNQGSPMGMPAMAGPPSVPGRAVAEAGAGPAPFRPRTKGSENPKILSHILGFSAIGRERSEARMRQKTEAHAMIPYNNEGTTINELPASSVFGR